MDTEILKALSSQTPLNSSVLPWSVLFRIFLAAGDTQEIESKFYTLFKKKMYQTFKASIFILKQILNKLLNVIFLIYPPLHST